MLAFKVQHKWVILEILGYARPDGLMGPFLESPNGPRKASWVGRWAAASPGASGRIRPESGAGDLRVAYSRLLPRPPNHAKQWPKDLKTASKRPSFYILLGSR